MQSHWRLVCEAHPQTSVPCFPEPVTVTSDVARGLRSCDLGMELGWGRAPVMFTWDRERRASSGLSRERGSEVHVGEILRQGRARWS